MTSQADILEKIRLFSENVQKNEKQRMDDGSDTVDYRAYNKRLDGALEELRDQVGRQEAVLNELRLSKPTELPRPGIDPLARLAQARRAKSAYEALTLVEPDLPAPNSPIPYLLTLRTNSQLIQELKYSISTTAKDLASDRERLKKEEANLRDTQMIMQGLKDRIKVLQTERPDDEQKTPSQIAADLIQQQRIRKTELERDAARLKDALDDFIDKHLASMLAAEDLGGPIVGDQVDVPDLTLECGFTAQGKVRKPKINAETGKDSRQQRIDVLVHRQREGEDAQSHGNAARTNSKREDAAAEMHALINSLLDAATTSYIELSRDSAASRFLVKAKIAQFHPRDSRRLRLIDVARNISD